MANVKISDLTEDTTPADGDFFESYDISAGASKKVTLLNFVKRVLNQTDSSFDWTTFSPTWTNLTVGNGTVDAKYQKIGKTCNFYITVTFGSTSSIAGAVTVSLPLTTPTLTLYQLLGITNSYDQSTGVQVPGQLRWASTTTATIVANDANSTFVRQTDLSSTVPMTWTTSDVLFIQGTIPVA